MQPVVTAFVVLDEAAQQRAYKLWMFHLQKLNMKKSFIEKRPHLFPFLFGLLIVIFLSLLGDRSGGRLSDMLSGYVIGSLVITIACLHIIKRGNKNAFDSFKANIPPMQYQFYDGHYERISNIVGNESSASIAYNKLYCVYETADAFYFFLYENSFNIVPKNMIADEPQHLHALLGAGLGERFIFVDPTGSKKQDNRSW